MDACRQWLAPTGLLGDRVEDREMLREATHERTAKLEWVFAGRPRHLVYEAFHVDGVLVGVDAAPWTNRDVGVAHHVFDEHVRRGVAELRLTRIHVVSL